VLTIEPPFYQIRGTTIFRDHERSTQFYYLPTRPMLAREGDALACTLYKYRRDLTDNPSLDPTKARGAGLAQFETEIPEPKLAVLQAELSSAAGQPDVTLSPVQFRSCEVHAIIARQKDDRFIEDLVESHPAPLSIPHHAAFALALSAEGATLFESAVQGGQLPVGVVYDMRFLALTPSLHAKVWMDYERIYDHFSASVGFTYYVSVKLDVDVAWLVEHDLIKIEIVAFTDQADADRQRETVMKLVAMRIQQDFFRSGMPPAPQEGASGPLGQMLKSLVGSSSSGITSASAFFVLKAKVEVIRERKDFELRYDGRMAVEMTHSASGFLSSMLDDTSAVKVLEIDLDDKFFSSLKVSVSSAIDFEAMPDLTEAAIHLAYGDHRQTFTFRKDAPISGEFEVAVSNPKDDEYSWEGEFFFDTMRGFGEPRLSFGPFRTSRRALVLQPLSLFHYQRLGIVRGPVDATLVPRLHVTTKLREPQTQNVVAGGTFRLTESEPDAMWRVHLQTPPAILGAVGRTDWEDQTGVVHEGEEQRITSDRYIALGPYREILEVTLQAAVNWTTSTSLQVEVRYRDDDELVTRQAVFTKDGPQVAQVQIPLRDRLKRQFEWRQLCVRLDGTVDEHDWTPSDRTLIVVGGETPTATDVRVVWVGDAAGALGLRVDLMVARDGDQVETCSAFLRAGQQEATIVLPPPAPNPLVYKWEVRRVDATGEVLLRSGEGRTKILVVQAN
jgi:hypothetical protein